MNNSKLALDSVPLTLEGKPNNREFLQGEEARVIRILKALDGVKNSQEWSSLKTDVFDELPKQLRKDLLLEARKDQPDTNKLNRLSGKLEWAEKFADLTRLENKYRVELQGIRMQLHGKSESNG